MSPQDSEETKNPKEVCMGLEYKIDDTLNDFSNFGTETIGQKAFQCIEL